MNNFLISRRTALRGLGVSMSLPLLDAMLPSMSFGQTAAAVAKTFPRRMAVCYIPQGVLPQKWNPTGTGKNFVLNESLKPLEPFREKLLILQGLTCDKARPHGDGTGDHARAQAAFLTGRQAKKTSGADIKCGISMDQLCAQRVGDKTRFPSLELGAEGGRLAGFCDPGYSCAYTQNLSWRGESTPAPKEINPRSVFDRLFASASKPEAGSSRSRREQYNKSILDFVLEDAVTLNNKLGAADQRRLDEYMDSIRDIEKRIANFPVTKPFTGDLPERPGTTPTDYKLHLRAMADLMAVAFQTDTTRISTFVFSNELSNRTYKFIDVPDGHHDVSHHMFDKEKMARVAKINRFHIEQFAYLLERLDSMKEGNGTVLDNSMILYGSGNGDGALHNHDELPVLLVGKAGGAISSSRVIRYPRNTPICNLYLEMLDRMDVHVDSFGDSTGRLKNLS